MVHKLKRCFIIISLCLSISFQLFSELNKEDKDLIEKYSIPEGPIKTILDKTFENASMANLLETLKLHGFEFLKNKETDLQLVAKHPLVNGFIIKARQGGAKFPRSLWKKSNIGRVKLSRKIDEYIKKEGLEHLVTIPKKWIYHIPNSKEEFTDENYIVVAEELLILPPDKTNFTQEQEEAIYKIIKKFGLFDSGGSNTRRTLDGKAALIDTEPPRTFTELIPIMYKIGWMRNILRIIYGKQGTRKFFKTYKNIVHSQLKAK